MEKGKEKTVQSVYSQIILLPQCEDDRWKEEREGEGERGGRERNRDRKLIQRQKERPILREIERYNYAQRQ